jgi:hypothetical protein
VKLEDDKIPVVELSYSLVTIFGMSISPLLTF